MDDKDTENTLSGLLSDTYVCQQASEHSIGTFLNGVQHWLLLAGERRHESELISYQQ